MDPAAVSAWLYPEYGLYLAAFEKLLCQSLNSVDQIFPRCRYAGFIGSCWERNKQQRTAFTLASFMCRYHFRSGFEARLTSCVYSCFFFFT